jgi:DNA polymerase IV (DinB-like DNA polymerase)
MKSRVYTQGMKIIGHLDMDAFFAAVEEKEKPWLAGYPIVVGADPKAGAGRGVVSTANYLARSYGIRSALPISLAWRFSEDARSRGKAPAIFITPNFPKYEEQSRRIVAIVEEFCSVQRDIFGNPAAPALEQTSIDECYIDFSFTGSYQAAEKIADKIKKAIRGKESLTASVGIGPNKLVAKLASDFKKPDGLTVVPEKSAADFVAAFPVRKIPGVGPESEKVFKAAGVLNVSDALEFSEEKLVSLFGKHGRALFRKFRGIDDAGIEPPAEAKSIGEQETFPIDTLNSQIIFETIEKAANGISGRLKLAGFNFFRTVVVTVRFDDFSTFSRSKTFPNPAVGVGFLINEAIKIVLPFFDGRENKRGQKIRMIGVRVEKLS